MNHDPGIAQGPGVGRVDLSTPLIVAETPPIVTTPVLLPAGARDKYVPLGPGYAAWAAGDDIIAITVYATPGSVRASVYRAGCFNVDAVNWPADTTFAQVQAAAENSPFEFRRLLWSDKPSGAEDSLVGPGHEAGPDQAVQLPISPISQTFAPQAAGAYSKGFTLPGAIGAVTWTKLSGSLPAATTLNASTGVVSGTATAGSSTFTLEGVDSQGQRGQGTYTQVIT